jgi:antitoxin ChpS
MPSSRDKGKARRSLTKRRAESKVREAVVAYLTEDMRVMPDIATAKLSSKHQITLPVEVVRRLGLEPGDHLAVRVEEGRIVLRPRPRDWVEYLQGSAKGVYGATKEEMDAYVRRERASWRREADNKDS